MPRMKEWFIALDASVNGDGRTGSTTFRVQNVSPIVRLKVIPLEINHTNSKSSITWKASTYVQLLLTWHKHTFTCSFVQCNTPHRHWLRGTCNGVWGLASPLLWQDPGCLTPTASRTSQSRWSTLTTPGWRFTTPLTARLPPSLTTSRTRCTWPKVFEEASTACSMVWNHCLPDRCHHQKGAWDDSPGQTQLSQESCPRCQSPTKTSLSPRHGQEQRRDLRETPHCCREGVVPPGQGERTSVVFRKWRVGVFHISRRHTWEDFDKQNTFEMVQKHWRQPTCKGTIGCQRFQRCRCFEWQPWHCEPYDQPPEQINPADGVLMFAMESLGRRCVNSILARTSTRTSTMASSSSRSSTNPWCSARDPHVPEETCLWTVGCTT